MEKDIIFPFCVILFSLEICAAQTNLLFQNGYAHYFQQRPSQYGGQGPLVQTIGGASSPYSSGTNSATGGDPLRHHVDFSARYPGEDQMAVESRRPVQPIYARISGYPRRTVVHGPPILVTRQGYTEGRSSYPSWNYFLPASSPWWKGANVCAERTEEEEDLPVPNSHNGGREDLYVGSRRLPMQLSTCEDSENKRVCTTRTQGPDKTTVVTTTYKCCTGYALNARGQECQRGRFDTVLKTMEDLGAKEFLRLVQSANLTQKAESDTVTVFVPTDNAVRNYLSSQASKNRGSTAALGRGRARRRRDSPSIDPSQSEEGTRSMVYRGSRCFTSSCSEGGNEDTMVMDFGNEDWLQNMANMGEDLESTTTTSSVERNYERRAEGSSGRSYEQPTDTRSSYERHYGYPYEQPAEESNERPTESHLEQSTLSAYERHYGYPYEQPTERPIERPYVQPTRSPYERHYGYPYEQPAERPREESTQSAYERRYGYPYEQPTQNDNEQTSESPLEESTLSAYERHYGYPYEQPTERPTERPYVQPTRRPYERHYERPSEESTQSAYERRYGYPYEQATELPRPYYRPTLHSTEQPTQRPSERPTEQPDERVFELAAERRTEQPPVRPPGQVTQTNGGTAVATMNHMEIHDIVLTHMVESSIFTRDITDEKIIFSENPISVIRMNSFLIKGETVYTANCVRMTSVNHRCLNGVIHVIDRMMSPVSQSLFDIISTDPNLSTFMTLLMKSEMLATLRDSNQHLTLFAPTNYAFSKLGSDIMTRLNNGDSCLERIIRNHVVPVTFCTSVFLKKGQVRNLNHGIMDIERNNYDLFVNGSQLMSTDVMATNGVIQVIDSVLLSPEDESLTTRLEEIGLTSFVKYLQEAQINIEELNNVTFFAPSNGAFESMSEEVKQDPQKLEKILKYHIATPATKSCDFVHETKMPTELSGTSIRLNLFSDLPPGLGAEVTAQCGRLTRLNDVACNGVIHTIDRVLTPAEMDIALLLRTKTGFNVLNRLIANNGLIDTLRGEGPLTMFAPTDAAFYALPREELDRLLRDGDAGTKLVKSHIFSETFCCTAFSPVQWYVSKRVQTLSRQHVTISRDVRGDIHFGNANVTACDLMATNGVIHTIDSVFVPE